MEEKENIFTIWSRNKETNVVTIYCAFDTEEKAENALIWMIDLWIDPDEEFFSSPTTLFFS